MLKIDTYILTYVHILGNLLVRTGIQKLTRSASVLQANCRLKLSSFESGGGLEVDQNWSLLINFLTNSLILSFSAIFLNLGCSGYSRSGTASVYKPVYKVTGLDQSSQNWSKVVNFCQNCWFWWNWWFWRFWWCQLNHRQKLTGCVQNWSKLSKFVNFGTFGANFIKIVNFVNFEWFSDNLDVNWIIDKSWHVHVKVVNSAQKCEFWQILVKNS